MRQVSVIRRRSSYTTSSSSATTVDIDEHHAGCGDWRPQYLQKLLNVKVFLALLTLLGIIQGSYFSYHVASASTLEKRWSYSSKFTGFVLIADNISQIMVSSAVGILGKRMNKSVLIGAGMMIVGLSCWLNTVPFFIYGPAKLYSSSTTSSFVVNKTTSELCGAPFIEETCTSNSSHSVIWPAFICIWFASFFNGLGNTAFFTLGYPYIDDNIGRKNAPITLAVITSLRTFGPTIGYGLTSFSLKLREDLSSEYISRTDPRFIGAWWLGFLIIGFILIVLSLPLFCFPRTIRGQKTAVIIDKDGVVQKPQKKPFWQDARETIIRLGKNPIIVFDCTASLFRYIGLAGYGITKPRYLESQYQKSAAESSLFAGFFGITAFAVGTLLGGALIRIFQPKPRMLATYIFLVELSMSLGIIVGFFYGCPKTHFIGFDAESPNPSCTNDCSCSGKVFQPACSSDGVTTYFSPCFAGCTSSYKNDTMEVFTGCSCDPTGMLIGGYCKSTCPNFMPFIIIASLTRLVSSTSRIGNIIIRFRSMDDGDKSAALGMLMAIFGLFGAIPYPLIFGAIADSACAFWKTSCGAKGNCWLYDTDKFRVRLHSAALGLTMMGSFFDLFVIYYSKRIRNMYGEEDEKEKKVDNGIELDTHRNSK